MKFEFTSLESGPLVYFLMHSGAFVIGMALLFFMLGLWFGALTWGRYRRYNRRLQEEGNTLREEIAGLKRKLAEQAVRPLTSAPPPPVNLLTEVLPSPATIFPERAAAKITIPEKTEEAAPVIPSIPVIPETLLPTSEFLGEAESPPAKSKPSPRLFMHLPAPHTKDVSHEPVEPFSFLLPDDVDVPVEESEPATEAKDDTKTEDSELMGIGPEIGFMMDSDETDLEDSASAPSPVIPENDPALGLIFKEPPPDADDLTRLQGISPALQIRLQEMGVYRFEQISTWNQSQVREFSRRLAFKDRIERERWVDQARRLSDAGSEKVFLQG
ncbi:putative flap endonuclease-1-like 5' DNA nuclease [Prosthecobacter fusiformis]|uniref:Putative flap endonuclease-1-like 5' DNA nuclease n=1 Tax=Prosthecobacter fusiformis TaxID=48464 RepID=A0A4R7S409_9BACT|nr:hypothetical protein [Prosthecobacter fusiformis]TDU73142.1 putative flap endonuclease-1-like 5' DNA nuclease [Prosthecobacter fusiformis]